MGSKEGEEGKAQMVFRGNKAQHRYGMYSRTVLDMVVQWHDTSLRTPSYIVYLGLVRRINTSSLAAAAVTLILSHYLRR